MESLDTGRLESEDFLKQGMSRTERKKASQWAAETKAELEKTRYELREQVQRFENERIKELRSNAKDLHDCLRTLFVPTTSKPQVHDSEQQKSSLSPLTASLASPISQHLRIHSMTVLSSAKILPDTYTALSTMIEGVGKAIPQHIEVLDKGLGEERMKMKGVLHAGKLFAYKDVETVLLGRKGMEKAQETSLKGRDDGDVESSGDGDEGDAQLGAVFCQMVDGCRAEHDKENRVDGNDGENGHENREIKRRRLEDGVGVELVLKDMEKGVRRMVRKVPSDEEEGQEE